jgi:hypothetical protein
MVPITLTRDVFPLNFLSQAICQFFQRGTCRYGSACKNDHVQGGGGGAGSAFFYQGFFKFCSDNFDLDQTYVRPGADKVGAYTCVLRLCVKFEAYVYCILGRIP